MSMAGDTSKASVKADATRPPLLIVEDEPLLLQGLKDVFDANGFQATAVNNGMFASGLVRNKAFSAIISDIKLPGMSGLQLVSAIRESSLNKDAPIFLITGYAEADIVKRASQLSIAKFMIKPFEIDDLFKLVSQHMAAKKAKTYDVRILNCCIKAAQEVIANHFKKPTLIGKPQVKGEPVPKGFASGTTCFRGAGISGTLTLTFDHSFVSNALTLAGGRDIVFASISADLACQVSSKIKENADHLGLQLEVGLPGIELGPTNRNGEKAARPAIFIPIMTDNATCVLEFNVKSLNEASQGPKSEDGKEVKESATSDDVVLF